MGKLFRFLKPYTALIITALIMVILGAVFTLVGPNRLSEVTDVIQRGVSVNLTLTNEEMATLKSGDEVEKSYSASDTDIVATFNYADTNTSQTIDDEDAIMVSISVSNEDNIILQGSALIIMEDIMLSENGYYEISQIQQGGQNIDSSSFGGIGLSYSGETYSLWLNTETKIDLEKIFRICIILVVLYLLAYVANFIEGYIMAIVNNEVGRNLRQNVIDKINKLPLKYFDKVQYGDVLSRMVNDVDTISTTLNNSFTSLIGAVTQFVGSLIMMFATNWIMALSGVLATLIGFALMFLIIRKSQSYFVEQQKALGQVNGVVEESYSGQQVIKAYNAEAEALRGFDKKNEKLYSSAWRAQFYSGIMHPLMGFIGNFGYVVVCIVGAVLVHNHVIGFAVIVAIMIYIRLFSQPLSQLGQASAQLQTTAAASYRVFDLLENEELSDESHITKELKKVKGDVEFKHVKFGYSPNKIIIKDFSAKIKAGQKVAIVGPTGAGKTTLVNLLMKFYDILDGDILIDGVSIKELKRENVHDLFGMVLQDTWLFQGTVKENLRFSKEDITDEQIIKACKICGVDHFIRTLPDGYDTVLDDNTNISAGQKQLLTITRAMLENAPMLILDEATSSVDTRTEILIQNAMDKLTKNRTSFVIAHRLSTIKNADLILVMKDGDIIEVGNHNELLAKGGFYAELYNSQFDN